MSRKGKYLRTKRSGGAPLTTLKERLLDSKIITKGRSLLPSWLQQQCYDSNESFLPCPKVTFLIDRPPALLCQICRDAQFELRSTAVDETTFSILPCGHVAGSQCLDTWCFAYDTCPFCRLELRYPGCGHRIPPRRITHESIHLLPRTVPDGGEIPALCSECLREQLIVEAEERFVFAAQEFRVVRRRVQWTGDRHDERDLLRAKGEVETMLRDEFHLRYLSSMLNSW